MSNLQNEACLEAALWMLAQLEPDTQTAVRRRLAIRLNPAKSRAEHRNDELQLVAELLLERRPAKGWTYSYIARIEYDARRTSKSPSSSVLVNRYGTWANVCRHADWLASGRPNRLSKPGSRPSGGPKRYSANHAVVALRECAMALDRSPSALAYAGWWRMNGQRRGNSGRYPCARTIIRLFVDRGGWIAALEEAGLRQPPKDTVRIVTATKSTAAELAAALRSRGHIVAHAGYLNWVELRATVEACLSESSRAELATIKAVWDPGARIAVRPIDGVTLAEL